MILPGEIKDAKMSSFSSDSQTLISSVFSLWIIDEFEKSKFYTNTSSSIYSYSKYP